MGILTRFKDIMSANINALLDKCEDPEKMIDQYMRNLESDLGKVKAETASVMAEETRAKRELDECTEQINKMQAYAEKALKAGNESDARSFLEKKQQLATTQAALTQAYNVAADNAAKMRQMHDKLVKDISSLEARRTAIKATVKAAKAQERINKVGSSVVGASNSMDAFNKMEAKANKMLDEANAMAELNASAEDSNIDNLAAKYDAEPANTAVDDEQLTYHKTLPYSTIVETDPTDGVTYDILYDILIKQNGDIHSDWDGTPLDVDAYEKVVFEPYDLRWLARIA